jgi:hypothetical protein
MREDVGALRLRDGAEALLWRLAAAGGG